MAADYLFKYHSNGLNCEEKNQSQAIQEGENMTATILEDLGFIILVFLSFNLFFYFSFFNHWFLMCYRYTHNLDFKVHTSQSLITK